LFQVLIPLTPIVKFCEHTGAFKFGDELNILTCVNLLTKLSTCQAPFQCAHGRPSLAPIINLDRLCQVIDEKALSERKKLNFAKLKKIGRVLKK
jgi:hypothetical protein